MLGNHDAEPVNQARAVAMDRTAVTLIAPGDPRGQACHSMTAVRQEEGRARPDLWSRPCVRTAFLPGRLLPRRLPSST